LIEVNTTSKDDFSFDLVIDEVLCFFESQDLKDKLSENYIKEELFLNSSDAITLVKEEDKIILFSTLFHRKIFKNAVRCLNRYYRPPQIRLHKVEKKLWRQKDLTDSTILMLQQQESIARNYGYDIMFFSRELKNIDVKDNSSYKKTAINYVRSQLNVNWILSPRVYLTCEGKSIRNCWQQIIYKKLRDNATLNIESISLKEYREKFVI
jgi:hypothetical protein